MSNIEIEKKYIILMPNAEDMENCINFAKSRITQIYLESDIGVTHRVRSRETAGKVVYTETKKIRIDKCSAFEDEREITEEEFATLIKTARADSTPIIKERFVFTYKGQLFEVDMYPQWKNTAILETELEARDKEVEFPSFLKIIKDVTGDKRYSNAGMARAFPLEEE